MTNPSKITSNISKRSSSISTSSASSAFGAFGASSSAVYHPDRSHSSYSSNSSQSGKDTPLEFSFGAVIQKYRKENGMSQPELAEILGVSRNTITNWENDRARPEVETIRELCTMFNIPLYELFALPNSSQLTAHEKVVFQQYRKLSPVGKRIVEQLISSVMGEEQDARDRYLDENCILLELPSTPAAAGTGCQFNDTPPSYIFVKKNGYNEDADAVICVSGASMEPRFYDGDMVYVKYTQAVHEGDIVICSTADGAVIKQMLNHKLYSLNKALPYGEKSEDDHVTIVGKVLGKISPLELPDDDDLPLLEEVKAAEVREFREKHGLM